MGFKWRCPLFWTILSEKNLLYQPLGVMVYSACRPEDRALLESNLSVEAGGMTERQSLMQPAFLFRAPPDSPKR